MANDLKKYQKIAIKIRKDILSMVFKNKAPHVGCSLGMVEILVALYFKVLSINNKNLQDMNRDRFILSKGHGCPALYATLFNRGIISKKIFDGFAKNGGTLEEHPNRNLNWGIETTSGSLGHGLSLGVGMALAAKYDKRKSKIFVFLGDGELDEGSNWEAIMFAAQKKLDNLVAIIDSNKLQILGKTSEVINLEPIEEKWKNFGWSAKTIDGHNFKEILSVFNKIPIKQGKPTVIVANTIKGKGISFMENKSCWHDKHPNEQEYKEALKELK